MGKQIPFLSNLRLQIVIIQYISLKKIMTDILHHSGTNPTERKRLEDEQEACRSVNAMFEDMENELMDLIQNKNKELD